MGTTIYIGADGLHDHEGAVGQVWDSGTVHGGGEVCEVNRRTVSWRAMCECGWLGDVEIDRQPGQSAWLDWEDLPSIRDEWDRHLEPFVLAARIEQFRRALMREHSHDWDMNTVSEAAHICARALAGSPR